MISPAIRLTTATTAALPAASSLTPDDGGSSKSKLVIIIVSCVGGFAVVLGFVLVLVPFLRRYFYRRQSREFQDADERNAIETHGQSASSAPLLSSKEPGVHEHSREVSDEDAGAEYGNAGPAYGEQSLSPRTPNGRSAGLYNPWQAGPSRSSRRLQTPLRRARTHIHSPMPSVPENRPIDPARPHMPEDPSASPPLSSESHPSWLHVPKPLITAFRKSIASSNSSTNTLQTMHHYPSFNSASVSATRSRSPDTFHSLSTPSFSSVGGVHGHAVNPVHHIGSLNPDQIPARLKPSGGAEQVAHVQHTLQLPGSRQASFAGQTSLGSESRTTMSVYTDARSRLDEESVGGGHLGSGGFEP